MLPHNKEILNIKIQLINNTHKTFDHIYKTMKNNSKDY